MSRSPGLRRPIISRRSLRQPQAVVHVLQSCPAAATSAAQRPEPAAPTLGRWARAARNAWSTRPAGGPRRTRETSGPAPAHSAAGPQTQNPPWIDVIFDGRRGANVTLCTRKQRTLRNALACCGHSALCAHRRKGLRSGTRHSHREPRLPCPGLALVRAGQYGTGNAGTQKR